MTPHLDHNIIVKDTLGQDVSMCGAMIYTPDKSPKKDIHFIELKDQMANWRQKAISQLGSTIQIFSQNHVLEDFRYRVRLQQTRHIRNLTSRPKKIVRLSEKGINSD